MVPLSFPWLIRAFISPIILLMDTTSLMLSLLFGTIGMGMFMYGKKAGRMVPLGAGLALMVVPYCVPNPIAPLIFCCALTVLPWFLRNA